MDEDEIIELAQARVFDLAYEISKKIDLSTVKDEQIEAGQLLSLIRCIRYPDDTSNTLLTEEQIQQVLQGLISIGNLPIQ